MLTQTQKAAHNKAVDMYVLAQTNRNGGIKSKPVILVPQFAEDEHGDWHPVQSNGIRLTKKTGFSFARFGMAVNSINANGQMETKVIKTNMFQDDDKLELFLVGNDITIGSAVPDAILVIEESLTPFNKKNPENDLKVAGVSQIPCTFTGEHNGVQYDSPAPIYRRVKLAEPGTKNTLITHTNKSEISDYAAAAWAKVNQANTAAIKGAAGQDAKEEKPLSRMDQLLAIPKETRTAKEKKELAALLAEA